MAPARVSAAPAPGAASTSSPREVVGELPELGELRVGPAAPLHAHTSASLTLNENASPDVRRDFESYFDAAVPEDAPYWTHTDEGPDDMPAHIKASVLGPSLSLPVADGRLALGTWQGIYLCEHRDRPPAAALLATVWGEELAQRPSQTGARFSAKAVGALAGVLGAEDRAGDLALALPGLVLAPVPAPRRGCAWSRRARAGRWRRSRPPSSRAAATASPGSASRLTRPTSAPRSAVIGSPVSAISIARW